MGKIRCKVNECKYNNKDYCIKEGIYVANDTFCESYKKGILDKKFLFEIALFEDDDKKIKCDACDCLHNNNKVCKAHCIKINEENKDCITYDKTKKKDN